MNRKIRTLALCTAGVVGFGILGAPSCDDGATHCEIGADAYAADTGNVVTDVEFIDRTSLGDQCDLTLDNGTEVEILVDLEDHSYRIL